DDEAADKFVSQIARDWREAGLSAGDRALCAYAVKLTQDPAGMCEEEINTLREHNFDDRAIHDATQVIAYFNYINRIADGLDVSPEDFVRPWEHASVKR
ncbi:MAG: hypothetical protein JSW55_07945, partial [Chloroflexota bacterium]